VDLTKPWYFNGQTILHAGLIFNRPEIVQFALEKNLSFEQLDSLNVSPSLILDRLNSDDKCVQAIEGSLSNLFF